MVSLLHLLRNIVVRLDAATVLHHFFVTEVLRRVPTLHPLFLSKRRVKLFDLKDFIPISLVGSVQSSLCPHLILKKVTRNVILER